MTLKKLILDSDMCRLLQSQTADIRDFAQYEFLQISLMPQMLLL